ncbi:MAG TPA: HDOD domain-containing protein [Gammaproteobacteria bacterium]|nr:HDOD domain-containing protein [Gammaproteobacteria bacterium]
MKKALISAFFFDRLAGKLKISGPAPSDFLSDVDIFVDHMTLSNFFVRPQPVNPSRKRKGGSRNSALVGRQSIYDRELNIFAYELLYRPSEGDNFAPSQFDGNKATSEVMLNSFLEVGLENIVGEKRAFINMTEHFVDGSIEIPLPKDSIVVEVLEDVKPTLKVIQGLKDLKSHGYVIALDDFVFDESLMPLVPFADIIKVDLMQITQEALKGHVHAVKKSSAVKLLAEKVETQTEFEFCKELGFDYFQGYFLDKPVIIKGEKIPANKIATLQLVNRLQDPDIEVDELDELIKVDVSLSYKILKYINSPGFGLGTEVTSIRQALMLLGIKNLKKWMSLIILSGLSDKPSDVIQKTLVRAKMCELIADVIRQENKEDYFLVGMFSMLDAMLSQDMSTVLEYIPISQKLKDALLKHKHKEGKVLRLVIAYEQGAWDDMHAGTIAPSSLLKAYLSAISWADSAISGLAHE